jgi:hypothetical protein
LARFTAADLFVEPEIRRRVILAFMMSLATTFAVSGAFAWICLTSARSPPRPDCRTRRGKLCRHGAQRPSDLGYVAFGFCRRLGASR